MKRCLPPLIVLLLPAAALATTYRWVDKNGQVNYSETPPLGQATTVVGAPTPPSAAPNQDSLNKSLDDSVKAEPKKRQEAEAAAAVQAQRDANCLDVTNQLAQLESKGPRHLSTKDADGNVSRMTVEDYEKRRTELQQYLKDKCS